MQVLALIAAILLIPSIASAQMTFGKAMDSFSDAFALTGDGVEVQQTDFQVGGHAQANILWPGEPGSITFHLKITGGYKGAIKLDVVHYGTQAIPGNMWKPHVFKIDDAGSTSMDVDLPAAGGFITAQPTIPDKFGGYAIVIEVPGKGRFFGASLCRAMAPEPGRVFLPTFQLDLGWPEEVTPLVFNSFKKMGIKGARTEGGYGSIADAHCDWAMQNNVTLMFTIGVAATPVEWQPMGRGRPWLNPDGSMIEKNKQDFAWMPQYDPQFKAYLKEQLTKYGWPNGPVNAVELWNEPWDGISISGWGADTLRFREIYRVMAQAVLEARKEAGVKVLIGGACSSTNTRDKLFSDGTDEFLPILDFVSCHYEGLGSSAALDKKWMNRTGEYGRVRVWDTESWVGNSEDRVAAVLAAMRSMGQDRTAGIYYRNVNDSQQPVIDGKHYAVCQVWSPGAAIAAADRMIGQREFNQILFKNGLPWIYEFNGLPGKPGDRTGESNVDDSTLVVVGDLGKTFERARCLHRSVGMTADAKMDVSDPDGKFILYDFYGNPVAAIGGKFSVPINGLGYFLRTDGTPGSFAKLVDAVKNSAISGVDPVEIAACDMTAPVSARPNLRVRLTNVLNRAIQGKVTATLGDLKLSPADLGVSLAANETKDFPFTVDGGNAADDNNYPLVASFEGPDGKVQHAEVMHVNFISKRTISVDGDLADWKGATPQTSAGEVGLDVAEQAYLPFMNWDKKTTKGKVKAYLAYDEKFFYFAAEVPKVTPTIRFGTRDDDSFFYPETVTDDGKQLDWPTGVRRFTYRRNPEMPAGHNMQIAFNVIPEDQKADMTAYPPGTMPDYCAFPDTDYEFALNECSDGGTEIFCLNKPGAPRKSFFPREPKSPTDGGPVASPAKLVFHGNSLECAIPWNQMPEVQHALQSGSTIKFSLRNNEGGVMELSANRSVSKANTLSFHQDWKLHWSNELEFGIEK